MAQMTARLPFLCVNNDETTELFQSRAQNGTSLQRTLVVARSMDEAIGPPASRGPDCVPLYCTPHGRYYCTPFTHGQSISSRDLWDCTGNGRRVGRGNANAERTSEQTAAAGEN